MIDNKITILYAVFLFFFFYTYILYTSDHNKLRKVRLIKGSNRE